jgi:hypothetical protein
MAKLHLHCWKLRSDKESHEQVCTLRCSEVLLRSVEHEDRVFPADCTVMRERRCDIQRY